jgi:molecular chaperone DnaK
VTFSIDVNGILNVSAKDLGTGKEQTVKIEQSSGLSEAEIEKMRKDADAHADEDQRKRKLAEARNQAHSLIYQTEKLLKEHADKLDAGSKSAIEAAVAKVKSKADGDDAAAIQQAVEELEQAAHAMSKQMYDRTGQAPPAGGAAPSGDGTQAGPKEEVIDAEYEKKE